MAGSPVFIATPRVSTTSLATANTALDGSGTIATLITGSASGTRVLEINTQASATSVAGLVNIFISANSGTSWTLFDQITIGAATSSNTAKCNRAATVYTNLVLPSSSHRLGVTTTISQAINVHALAGDL